ncbi:MAG: immunoglobulin domain-containing protein, partial [Limisphaerales bacterium]
MRRSTIFLRNQLRCAIKDHHAGSASWALGLAAFLGAAVVSLTGQTVPPTISTPPQSQTVNPGASVTFSVVATGTDPLSYQWQYNLADIPGAITSSLTLNNVQASIAGSYQVVVSNAAGSASATATLVVNTPPLITGQPANQAVYPGTNVTFVVIAIGTPPLQYQWQFNGSDLPGAVKPILTLTNVQPSDSGGYKALVSNVAGSVASAAAILTVAAPATPVPPTFMSQPQSQSVTNGATVQFCVTTVGSAPISYQWFLNGVPLREGGNLSGTTNSCLTILGAQSTNAGSYSVTAGNAVGTVTSEVGVLLVQQAGGDVVFSNIAMGINTPVFDVDGVTRLAGAGYLAQLYAGPTADSLTAVGPAVPFLTGTLAGYWSVLPGSVRNIPTVAPGTLAFVQVRVWQSGTGITFEQASAAGSKLGESPVLSVTTGGGGLPPSPPSALTGLQSFTLASPPSISNQPASLTVNASGTATFNVIATGAGPVSYQWEINGAPIAGATNATLTLANLQPTQAGSYTVVVSNPVGAVTSAAAVLTVLVPPTIATEPLSQAVTPGATVTFSVGVTGTSPLNYQWRFNGTPMGGAIGASLTLANVQLSQAGSYSVAVSNAAGSATSTVAVLTVLVPPAITTGPVSQTVVAGTNVTFSVTATGASPLSYQWQFNTTPIPGAIGASVTLANVQPSQAGNYTVAVTNAAGSITSAVAVLTILVPPAIPTEPASQTVVASNSVTFNVIATGTSPLSYQWWFNSRPIPGATTTNLSLNSVTATNAGSYIVTVSNVVGSVTSSNAVLTVNAPVTITQQPQSLTVSQGTNVT